MNLYIIENGTKKQLICNVDNEIISNIKKNLLENQEIQYTDSFDLPHDNTLDEEIYQLKSWFNTYYTEHEQKYRRLNTLKQLTDNKEDPCDKLVELYKEAEEKRKRIQELENIINT